MNAIIINLKENNKTFGELINEVTSISRIISLGGMTKSMIGLPQEMQEKKKKQAHLLELFKLAQQQSIVLPSPIVDENLTIYEEIE